jgi:hypothetical protein
VAVSVFDDSDGFSHKIEPLSLSCGSTEAQEWLCRATSNSISYFSYTCKMALIVSLRKPFIREMIEESGILQ